MDENKANHSPLTNVRESVTVAICITSVVFYGTAAVFGLALAVAVGVFTDLASRRLFSTSSVREFSSALLSSTIAIVLANITTAVVGIAGLEKGTFCACAIAVTLVLRYTHREKGNLKATSIGVGIYALSVTFAAILTEFLGTGHVFGISIPWAGNGYVNVFNYPAGGMIVSAITAAIAKYMTRERKVKSGDGEH